MKSLIKPTKIHIIILEEIVSASQYSKRLNVKRRQILLWDDLHSFKCKNKYSQKHSKNFIMKNKAFMS
jgi:hypothetical protein